MLNKVVATTIKRALGCKRSGIIAGGSHKKERYYSTMKREIIKFAVESKNGIITNIGRSTITQPTVNFVGGSVKWFDDTKLLKTNKEKEKCYNE